MVEMEIIATKVSYRLFLFQKEGWAVPEFIGRFLYDHDLAIRVFENVTLLSVSRNGKDETNAES